MRSPSRRVVSHHGNDLQRSGVFVSSFVDRFVYSVTDPKSGTIKGPET